MAYVGAVTMSTASSDRLTSCRYRFHFSGGAPPLTAAHQDVTHECAVSTTGLTHGSAPCPYEFKWIRSGAISRSSSRSHRPDASTSAQGSSIHSNLKVLSYRRAPARRASARCALVGNPPSAASATSMPRRPRASANSSEKLQTPPTVSVVISMRLIDPVPAPPAAPAVVPGYR